MVSEPPALEGAAAEQGEVELLRPRELAPKRLRDRTIEQDGRGKQQRKRKGNGKEGAEKKRQGDGKWSMPGFRVDPGGAELVAGRYTVKAMQSQVSLQGAAGRETWLGVDLLRGGGRTKFTGWIHSGELQSWTSYFSLFREYHSQSHPRLLIKISQVLRFFRYWSDLVPNNTFV